MYCEDMKHPLVYYETVRSPESPQKSHSTRNPSISMGRGGQKPLGQLTLKHAAQQKKQEEPRPKHSRRRGSSSSSENSKNVQRLHSHLSVSFSLKCYCLYFITIRARKERLPKITLALCACVRV